MGARRGGKCPLSAPPLQAPMTTIYTLQKKDFGPTKLQHSINHRKDNKLIKYEEYMK